MSPLREFYTGRLRHGGVSVFVIFAIPKNQRLGWWGTGTVSTINNLILHD